MHLSKGKVEETMAAVAKISIADITAEVENDLQESVRKLAQAHDVSARMVHAALMRT
jgi:hypothetical protein